MMIDQVKKAIQQIEELPPEQQLEIAEMIEDKIKWDRSYERTSDKLDLLAKEATKEYEEGKTSDKDW